MTETALYFDDDNILGSVVSVDTSNVSISIDSPDLITTVAVGDLVAIQGSTEVEFLIGITERTTRSIRKRGTFPRETNTPGEPSGGWALSISPG